MMPNYSAEEEATAFHAAGHAIAGAVRDRPPLWVTVIAADGAFGKLSFPKTGWTTTSVSKTTRLKNAATSKPAFDRGGRDDSARLALS